MVDFDYTPTPAEESMAQKIDGLVDQMLNGQLAGISVCAVNVNGEEAFFYLNKADQAVLGPPMNKLLGLYETNQRWRGATNAPSENRSYRSH